MVHLPTHGAHETWIQVEESNSLLSHSSEFLAEWEWQLSNAKSAENGSDCLEHNHIYNTLNILLNHVTHHVWVLHHLSHLIKDHLLMEISALWGAKVGLSLLH